MKRNVCELHFASNNVYIISGRDIGEDELIIHKRLVLFANFLDVKKCENILFLYVKNSLSPWFLTCFLILFISIQFQS